MSTNCVVYRGRHVTTRWYRRYVLRACSRRIPRICVWATLYLPPTSEEPAELRMIHLERRTWREWVREMCSLYASVRRWGLPTFFPNHP